jgi:hypothetical protein
VIYSIIPSHYLTESNRLLPTDNKLKKIKFFVAVSLVLLGVSLFGINLYGLTQQIRADGLESAPMRFNNDLTISYSQTLQELPQQEGESKQRYAERMTSLIAGSLAHIRWAKEIDTSKYHQLIPIWENYFLYFMGIFSSIPEYEKYHFADYKRSLKRGIGICGDASMIMSQVLNQVGIDNKIIAFPGHVIISAQVNENSDMLFDPDFGVAIPVALGNAAAASHAIIKAYSEQGHSVEQAEYMANVYSNDYSEWNGVQHFITKKYYFEHMAYFLKWPMPIIFMLLGIFLFRREKHSL